MKIKYQVNHEHHSGGPKFTSLWEALRYVAHVLKNYDADSVTISKERQFVVNK